MSLVFRVLFGAWFEVPESGGVIWGGNVIYLHREFIEGGGNVLVLALVLAYIVF